MVDQAKLREIAETAAPALDSYVKYYELAIANTDAKTNAVAWEVAVVSPGFLGLLWNVKELAQITTLTPEQFKVAFLACELLFVAAIISALIIYSFLLRLRNSHETMAASVQIMRIHLANQLQGKDTAESLSDLVQKAIDEFIPNTVHEVPRAIRMIAAGYVYFAVAGYLALAVILSTARP